MTTLTCRYLDKFCLDTLTAADATEIQKVFLVHIYAKHPQQWKELSRQSRSASLVTMRNRFRVESADPKTLSAAA